MIKTKTLEQLIREKIFLGPVSNTGYHRLKCECCHDYQPRAGFKFEDNSVFYSCFNCGLKPMYEEDSGKISKKMRSVLNDFGIADEEIDKVINSSFFNKDKKDTESTVITLASMKELDLSTPEIKLPPKSFRLGGLEHQEIQAPLIKYLKNRAIDVNEYPFWFSLEPRYDQRVIIPFYRNKKIIYWQARTILDDVKPRYDNCSAPKTAVIFNYDQLYSWSKLPLFVTEGVFDAISVNGIALLGSMINENKIEVLSKCKRRLIFVIDPDKTGRSVALKAIEHGWDITFTSGDFDINKSIIKYGRLWTIYNLMKNIPKNKFEAELRVNLLCKETK